MLTSTLLLHLRSFGSDALVPSCRTVVEADASSSFHVWACVSKYDKMEGLNCK